MTIDEKTPLAEVAMAVCPALDQAGITAVKARVSDQVENRTIRRRDLALRQGSASSTYPLERSSRAKPGPGSTHRDRPC